MKFRQKIAECVESWCYYNASNISYFNQYKLYRMLIGGKWLAFDYTLSGRHWYRVISKDDIILNSKFDAMENYTKPKSYTYRQLLDKM